MTPSSSSPVRLDIHASDDATEIFVIDGALERIASGVGALEVDVPPGLYKVRFRSGNVQHDELVSVPEGAVRVPPVYAPPLAFRSAAPLAATRTTHEYHMYPAMRLSRTVHRTLGAGAELFVFLRDEDEAAGAVAFPADAFTILTPAGTPLARAGEGEAVPDDRYVGLNVALLPGPYLLRVDGGEQGRFELALTLVPGWQTQVFLAVEGTPGSGHRGPSLRGASVLMAPQGAGFVAERPGTRLADLARIALEGGRSVASEALQRLLQGKFEDPLLGLYGVHLLLRQPAPERPLIEMVADTLRALLGDHPDVRVLRLHLGLDDDGRPFDAPPMLRASWTLLMQAARDRPGLILAGSPVERASHQALFSGPWLVFRAGAADAAPPPASAPPRPARGPFERSRAAAPPDDALPRLLTLSADDLIDRVKAARSRATSFTALEGTLLEALTTRAAWAAEAPAAAPGEDAAALRAALTVPPTAVDAAAGALARKLGLPHG